MWSKTYFSRGWVEKMQLTSIAEYVINDHKTNILMSKINKEINMSKNKKLGPRYKVGPDGVTMPGYRLGGTQAEELARICKDIEVSYADIMRHMVDRLIAERATDEG